MRILIVVGARPQFIKASPLLDAFESNGIRPYLVHTGQHYDDEMSERFFRELKIAQPDVNLGVRAAGHGRQTGEMLAALEGVMLEQSPDWAVVVGDTNSTLAGALAAAKLRIRVAHVEAGLRSYNRTMPEEINRVLADHVSDVLFAPTVGAVGCLRAEGIAGDHVLQVGDVMFDAFLRFSPLSVAPAGLLDGENSLGEYVLVSIHRAENTDDEARLTRILQAVRILGERNQVIFPVHPRTAARAPKGVLSALRAGGVRVVKPVGYLEMLFLEQHAAVIATDSGGVQKEAFFAGVPCVTLRDETEWTELVASGWNQLCYPSLDAETMATMISNAVSRTGVSRTLYGDGQAAQRIVRTLMVARP